MSSSYIAAHRNGIVKMGFGMKNAKQRRIKWKNRRVFCILHTVEHCLCRHINIFSLFPFSVSFNDKVSRSHWNIQIDKHRIGFGIFVPLSLCVCMSMSFLSRSKSTADSYYGSTILHSPLIQMYSHKCSNKNVRIFQSISSEKNTRKKSYSFYPKWSPFLFYHDTRVSLYVSFLVHHQYELSIILTFFLHDIVSIHLFDVSLWDKIG